MAQIIPPRTSRPDPERRADDPLQAKREQARVEECQRAYREEAAGQLMLAVLGRRRHAAE